MIELVTRWMKLLLLFVVLAAVVYFMSKVGGLVKMLVIAALLAYMLDPVVRFLESYGMGRTSSTVVIFVAIVGVAIVLSFIFLPMVTGEIKAVREGIATGKGTGMLENIEKSLETKLSFLGVKNLNLIANMQSYLKKTSNEIYGHLLNVVSIVSYLFFTPFIMFFLLKDGPLMIKQFISLMPNSHFEFTLNLIHKTDKQLGGYLRGQFLDSAIIGLLALIALVALNVKYYLIIGIFTGIANLVPFIGPIVGAVPAVIVALVETGGTAKPLYVALAFTAIQMIDNAVVKPVVVAKMVSMHPLVVMLVVIIGGKFFGIIGMLLSVPAAGIIKLVIEEAVNNLRMYRFT